MKKSTRSFKHLFYNLALVLPQIILIAFLLTLAPILIYSMVDPTNDTTPLTNIGFAILAAISSVAFSWARAIDQKEKHHVDAIIHAGECALMSSLLFLIASACKYVAILLEKKGEKITEWMIYVYAIICIVFFAIAVIAFFYSINIIGLTLMNKLRRPRTFLKEMEREANNVEIPDSDIKEKENFFDAS